MYELFLKLKECVFFVKHGIMKNKNVTWEIKINMEKKKHMN